MVGFGGLKSRLIAVDTETTGLFPWKGDRPFAVSFCDSEGNTEYLRAKVNPFTRAVTWTREQLEKIRSVCDDASITKVMFNANFDQRMLESIGIKTRGRIEEAMYAAHACNTMEISFELKALARKYLEIPTDDEKALRVATSQARRAGAKLGWKLAEDIEADYWMADDPVLVERYASLDAERTMGLWLMYEGLMINDPQWRKAYDKEIALRPLVYVMGGRGVYVSKARLQKAIKAAEKQMALYEDALQSVIRPWLKKHANTDQVVKFFKANKKTPPEKMLAKVLNSGLLASILFKGVSQGGLGLEPAVFSEKTGKPSVSFESLINHTDHEFVDALLRFKAYEDALENFFHKFEAIGEPTKDGKGYIIHPSFNQAGLKTARFSCKNPPMQCLTAADTARSYCIVEARSPFGPRPGYTWYILDFKQLEVRIFANESGDEIMLRALNEAGRDLHTETANKAWGQKIKPTSMRAMLTSLEYYALTPSTPEVANLWKEIGWKNGHTWSNGKPFTRTDAEAVAKALLEKWKFDVVAFEKSIGKKNVRNRSKMLLFSKMFGGGVKTIMKQFKCSRDEAQEFLDDYDKEFPSIVRYMRRKSLEAERNGYITNRYGRKLTVDPDRSYCAVNYMIQGSAADLLKDRMVALHRYLQRTGRDAHIVLTIHDELIFEIRNGHDEPWLLKEIQRIMEDHTGHFDVPLPTDMTKATETWAKEEPVELN